MFCSTVNIKFFNVFFSSLVDNFLRNYEKYSEGWVLPYSALQLDSNEDEKMTLWRVLVMENKIEEFINGARRDKVNAKIYDEQEILALPEEMKEKEQLKVLIEQKKVKILVF